MLSGSGRTLTNLAKVIASKGLDARVALVISSKPEDVCAGVTRGREALSDSRVAAAGVDVKRALVVRPGVIPAAELKGLLDAHRIDVVVLAGYLKMIEVPGGSGGPGGAGGYEGRIVNIHPSLLPSFGGRGMYGDKVHEAVLKAGVKETGCTVHLVNAEYDDGPVLVQRRCEVRPGDDVRSLAARVFEQECIAYPEGIAMVIERIRRGRGG